MKFSVRGDARWPRDEVRAYGLKRELHPTEIWEKSENSLIFFSFTEKNFATCLYSKFETIKKGPKRQDRAGSWKSLSRDLIAKYRFHFYLPVETP